MSGSSDCPIPSIQDVQRHVLDNGLVVLTRESHHSPTVTSMIWYSVGSADEMPGGTGSSHFLEHMMFKGTARYGKGAIDQLTMRNGGSNNAFTSYDFTAYYFSFASDRWEIALDIEADRMVHMAIDPHEFEAERQVVIEELKSGLDQPWGRLMQDVNREAYQRHPYRNPVIGWLPDLKAATPESMKSHYVKYYQPSNAVLVLVGDFQTQRALDLVSKAFGRIPGGENLDRGIQPDESQSQEKRLAIQWRSHVPRMAIAYHAPAIGHPDSYALHVLAVILAEGKASRLYQRLVENEQATTFVTAEYAESRDPTLFYIRAEGGVGRQPDDIEASVHDELSRIGEGDISSHELERARHQIEAHFVFSMERTLDQAMLLGQVEVLAELEYIDQYLPQIAKVDQKQVADVCRRYLCAQNRTVAWLLGGDGDR